jgi:hypothetical protein
MYPSAIEAFDRAINADPGFALAYAAKVHALLERGDATHSMQQHYRGVTVETSVLDVSSPVAKASAAALIRDCACARATAARAVASPVCAEVASVNVPTPCA